MLLIGTLMGRKFKLFRKKIQADTYNVTYFVNKSIDHNLVRSSERGAKFSSKEREGLNLIQLTWTFKAQHKRKQLWPVVSNCVQAYGVPFH